MNEISVRPGAGRPFDLRRRRTNGRPIDEKGERMLMGSQGGGDSSILRKSLLSSRADPPAEGCPLRLDNASSGHGMGSPNRAWCAKGFRRAADVGCLDGPSAASDQHLPLARLIIDQRLLGSPAVARDIAAGALAVSAYIIAALCVGWLVSIPLGAMGYAWPRFAIEAAVSTCLGTVVSWLLTNAVLPRRSGKVVFAAFAGVVLLVSLLGRSTAQNWLHIGQAVLLLALAYGLFWPHRRQAP